MNTTRIVTSRLFFTVVLGAALVCCSVKKLPCRDITIENTQGSRVCLNVEIADTPQTRQHGYMGRKKIPEGTGMIFVFPKDQELSFWMKNTPHALSIAYVDSKGCIRDIFNMTPFSTASITSTVSVRYAIEVPQGWFEKNQIKEGCMVNLEGIPAARE